MNDPNRKPGSEQATMVAGSSASGASSPARAFALTGVNLSTILETGTVLSDRYEIIEMLGIGGMGAVYKARDRELDRVIALKVIRPDLANDPMILQRFKQELLLARQVTHRNIIRIFDLGESTGMRFITMEFVEGTDLRGVITDRGKLSGEEATKIMRQVLSGLAAAHSEGVIHRDLKPSNIMCDKQGRVVVMDFGLACRT
jgi:serine/threonine protein kinase